MSVAFRDFNNTHLSLGMLCYFLYWLIQFPFMFVSPQKIRFLFLAKAIIVPPTWLALLIWAFVRVPLGSSLLKPSETSSGNRLVWAWLNAFNSAVGLLSNQGISMPNYTVSGRILYNGMSCDASTEICEERKSVRNILFQRSDVSSCRFSVNIFSF